MMSTSMRSEFHHQPGPPPEHREKEAHFSGLFSREDIQERFRMLDGDLKIEHKKEDLWGTKDVYAFPASEHPHEFTESEQAEYREDFETDIQGLHRRLQRLKVRICSRLLAGTKLRQEELSSDEEAQTPFDQVRMGLPIWFEKAKEMPEQARQRIVKQFNAQLPSYARLRAVEDLRARDLVQLYEMASSLSYGTKPDTRESERLQKYLEEVSELEELLFAQQNQGELFAVTQTGAVSEQVYQQVWDQYRDLIREIATQEELSSWYSPTYGSSGKGQRGASQRSQKFSTDYQRFRMPEMEKMESRLTHEYVLPEQEHRGDAKSVLFNSGLHALNAVLLDIADTQDRERRVKPQAAKRPFVIDTGVYYEAFPEIKTTALSSETPVIEMKDVSVDEWFEFITEQIPQVVFLDPMSIGLEMRVNPVTELFRQLSEMDWDQRAKVSKELSHYSTYDSRVHIVIDNTSLGQLAAWKNYVTRLPSFIRVYAIESMVKYAQDGQEISQAGLVTAFQSGLSSYPAEGLLLLQGRSGFRPPESVVRRLEAVPPSEDIEEKMLRHSRNATFLAREIQSGISKTSYLREVIYPGLESHPDHALLQTEALGAAGLLNIRIGPDNLTGYAEQYSWGNMRPFDDYEGPKHAKAVAEAFELLVIQLAKEVGVEINTGTSYGFATTRIAVYSHGLKGLPYMRIAVGTENTKDILLIAEVLKRANEIFSQVYQDARLIEFTRVLEHRETQIEFSGSSASSMATEA